VLRTAITKQGKIIFKRKLTCFLEMKLWTETLFGITWALVEENN
jgi:hypothetical protein